MNKKEMRPYRVVNYALILNKYLWTNPNAPNIILYYAVGRESENIDICDTDAFKQVVFLYYNNRDRLPDIIREEIEEMEDFPDYSDVRGYDPNGNFYPDEEIDFLLNYSDSHQEFGNNCRDWYKFYLSFSGQAKFYLEYDSDKFGLYLEFKRYYPTMAVVPTSLPKDILLESQYYSSSRDFALLAMYSAIRSIIGRKEIAATTRAFIHARMFGCKNVAELSQLPQSIMKIADEYNPENHRRKFKTLLNTLCRRGLVSCRGICARIFVSMHTDKHQFDDLVNEFIHRKKERTP